MKIINALVITFVMLKLIYLLSLTFVYNNIPIYAVNITFYLFRKTWSILSFFSSIMYSFHCFAMRGNSKGSIKLTTILWQFMDRFPVSSRRVSALSFLSAYGRAATWHDIIWRHDARVRFLAFISRSWHALWYYTYICIIANSDQDSSTQIATKKYSLKITNVVVNGIKPRWSLIAATITLSFLIFSFSLF